MQAHASHTDYERALEGMAFPTSLSAVIRAVSDHGGLDREVLEMTHRLPDRQYESVDDLITEIRRAYAASGVEPPV